MILHVYLARRFLRSFVIVLAVFIAILLPIDLAEQLRAIGTPDAGLRQAFQLALLNLPGALYRMLPLFIILSTLVLFLSLSRTSELVVVRASGRSALKSTISPVLMSILIGLIGLLIINPLVAATERQYEVTIQQFQTGEERTLSVSGEGLWLRQGNAAGQTVIRAARANADGTELFAASFFVYDEGGQALRRIDADRAALVDGAWQMAGAKIWPLTVANPEAEAVTHETYALASTLTRDQIRDSFGRPSTVPIYELPRFIAQLRAAGFAALQHRVWLMTELANPLMLAAMVLIAASFTMRHTRFGKTGIMVLFALLLGFGIFFLRSFAQVLGESGQLPVAVAAWTPPLAAILLSLGFLFHTEDG
ncbi:LPS export ABC transporter permease LptG [Alterinioella nitratireducens]|uniref:LPS export ABC transporter permease LptG n=1 Tax=Alterinioella nitratireducens TaxID=2735915 RepID=UPI001555FEB0|nr:LPS export ABC transporter permease LptG [Alterinioella nitratireducens]NPD20823.1 LPS export ABC transporter permease LptG [Alterinioella nitratireducens]